MKKSDLKNRMVVECRNGNKYMVIDNILVSTNGYNYLSRYTSDLFMKTTPSTEFLSEYDIMKVYKQINIFDFDIANNIIWERSEVKKVTMADVEKKFGCKIKIVKE